MKTIEEQYFKGKQSVEYRHIFVLKIPTFKPYKLKTEIKIDSYDFQSSARVYVWKANDLEWSTVASIPYSKMKSIGLSIYDNLGTQQKGLIKADADTLFNLAKEILS
jgi:hypothetical protein